MNSNGWELASSSLPDEGIEVETFSPFVGRALAKRDLCSSTGWRETWSGQELNGVEWWKGLSKLPEVSHE